LWQAGGDVVSYIQEKGTDRATIEDVGELTRIVEDNKIENASRLPSVSHRNAVPIEQFKAKHA
jgi:hypothetical protein